MTTTAAASQVETAHQRLSREQTAIISGLGRNTTKDDDTTFVEGEEYMDCLKDLLRYLRREHPSRRPLCVLLCRAVPIM
jgi:hypothetical protein